MADQTTRVYDSEIFVRRTLDSLNSMPTRTVDFYGSTLVIPEERKFGDVAGVQRYVDQLLRLNWVRDTWSRASRPLGVRKRRGVKFAHYEPLTATIAVPLPKQGFSWALREIVVLHEVAHHLSPAHGHGPAFTRTFLDLVTEISGPEVGLLLTDSFAMHQVVVSAKRVSVNA